MGRLGIPEVFIILLISLVWVVPVVAGIWALVTLHRIRNGQQALQAKIESIERMLQRS